MHKNFVLKVFEVNNISFSYNFSFFFYINLVSVINILDLHNIFQDRYSNTVRKDKLFSQYLSVDSDME